MRDDVPRATEAFDSAKTAFYAFRSDAVDSLAPRNTPEGQAYAERQRLRDVMFAAEYDLRMAESAERIKKMWWFNRGLFGVRVFGWRLSLSSVRLFPLRLSDKSRGHEWTLFGWRLRVIEAD